MFRKSLNLHENVISVPITHLSLDSCTKRGVLFLYESFLGKWFLTTINRVNAHSA